MMQYNKITPEEEKEIEHKGTERPFTGEYNSNKVTGTYVCHRCSTPLYRSNDKFDSNGAWPDFDDELTNATSGFFSKKNSVKNKHIETDKFVQLFYTNNGSSEYLSVYGEATIS